MFENKYEKYSSLLYDTTKPPGKSVDGDLEFYKELLLPVEGKVLEAGVGNGRLLIPFKKYKINIVGIDKSIEMIDLCEKNLKSNELTCEIIHKDLIDLKSFEEFEFIIMPNASFCLIESRLNAEIILKNFFIALKPSGKLALDLIFPVEFKVGVTHEFTHNLNETSLTVKNYSKTINWLEQYTINEINYLIHENIVETQIVKLSWYGIYEFKMLLEKIGFKNIQIVVNYKNKKIINIKTVTFIMEK